MLERGRAGVFVAGDCFSAVRFAFVGVTHDGGARVRAVVSVPRRHRGGVLEMCSMRRFFYRVFSLGVLPAG